MFQVNSFVVYHRRTNFHLVLRVVHTAYFLQKMALTVLGEIYLQRAFGFCESGKVLVLSAVWRHSCIPRNRF